MPKPEIYETKEQFISRAVKEFIGEGLSRKQAVGRAYGFWKSYSKKKKQEEKPSFASHA